jgi:hypothetical protein
VFYSFFVYKYHPPENGQLKNIFLSVIIKVPVFSRTTDASTSVEFVCQTC